MYIKRRKSNDDDQRSNDPVKSVYARVGGNRWSLCTGKKILGFKEIHSFSFEREKKLFC